MTLEQLLILALVGLVAGFAASHLVSGHGYGVVGDIVVGVIGALLGWFVLGAWLTEHVLAPLGVPAGSFIGEVIVAFIGAAILLAVLRLVSGMGRGRSGNRSSERGRSWRGRSWRRG
jgi:uncharacterized membrane protein YeaQ/YmgE (transglycosylase-associated protein family)